jgi:hypothetical protein
MALETVAGLLVGLLCLIVTLAIGLFVAPGEYKDARDKKRGVAFRRIEEDRDR